MSEPKELENALAVAHRLIELAQKSGAEAADAVVFESISLDASYRLGKLEEVQRSESQDLGLRVFMGKRQASVSTTDFADATLATLAERAVAMAKIAPEDPYCGLAPKELLANGTPPDLDLFDPLEPSSEDLASLAAEAEEAALAVDGITNSEGASGGWGRGGVAIAASNGFSGAYGSTSFSVSCAVIAGEGTAMEVNYDYESAHHRSDLGSPSDIGKSAAARALRALAPRRAESQQVPIVYEDRLSNSLLRHFASAILGSSVARGTSFLKDKMGAELFARHINIEDDPHRPRGMSSKPFDAEGLANRKNRLIENGVLKTWLLDLASARQLELEPTGHASRGTGGPPGPSWTNLYMQPGTQSPQELISEIDQGLFVNNMFGPSINWTSGDYSVGVSGLWIDKGELAYPVNEITIAGNLVEMFKNITPANDLTFRYGTNAPTLRVDGMTVAGA